MTTKVLITGATGMGGSHMASFYSFSNDYEVHVLVRPRSNMANLRGLNRLVSHAVDIRDGYGVLQVVQEGFDLIHHMAAITFVPYSWNNPHDTVETNVVGTINVLEAARRSSTNPVIHISGSSEEYGLIKPEEVPIKETVLLRPHSPYGVSKVAQDLLAQQYHQNYGLKTVITRAFNHTSPRQNGYMIVPTLVTQALKIKKGEQDCFYLGNLAAVREMMDWRDIVAAYNFAVKKCRYGEPYNVATGRGYSVGDLLEVVTGMADVPRTVKTGPERLRPTDIPVLVGDGTKFQEETGWKAQYTLKETIEAVYKYHSGPEPWP